MFNCKKTFLAGTFLVSLFFVFAEKAYAANSDYLYQILSTGQSLAVFADRDPDHFLSTTIGNKFFSIIGQNPIVSNHAEGGKEYAYLKKNGTGPAYANGMSQLAAVHNQAIASGKIHKVIGVTTIHGESDEFNGVTADEYKGYLEEWQHDYETDIKTVTNQSGTVPLYTCQLSSLPGTNKTHPSVAIGQLDATKENPDKIILVGPKYFLKYMDNFHLDDITNESRFGSKLLSEYYAKVIDLVFNQKKQWKPLMPTSVVRNGKEIYAKFHIPQNATKLEFDTALVAPMTHMGFEYFDSTSSSSISIVEIVNNDTIKITLNNIPTGSGQKLNYAYTGVSNTVPGAGRDDSLKGNLRDNDATTAMFDPSVRLYNWAVHFSEPIRVDSTLPNTTILTKPAALTRLNTASFTFSSNEANSTFQCKLDAGAYAACTSPKSYANLSQGSHTLSVRAIDSVNQVDATPATYAWTVDSVFPNTTIDNIVAKPDSPAASFFFSSSETGGTFQCKLDAGAYAACTSPKNYTALAQGSHTFNVRSIDKAGNIDASSASYAWTVDTVLPNTTITNAVTNLGVATFTFSSNETGGTFQCRMNAGAYVACTSPRTYTGLADGSYTFSVKAIDKVNNADTTPASYAWTVDSTIPNTTINTTVTNLASATFTFSSSEAGSTFQCKMDAGAYAACTSPKSYAGLSQGSHTFTARATDAVNVDATPASYTWTIDTVLPNTMISNIATINDEATFTFSSTETGGTFQCKLDNGAYAACTSPKSYSGLAIGNHTFSVKAIDASNNADTSAASYSWVIENTPPIISNVSPSGNLPAGTTSATLAFTTNENAICRYATTANVVYTAMTENFTTTGGKTHSKEIINLTSGTSYGFFVRCQDAIGNANNEDYPISFSVEKVASIVEKDDDNDNGDNSKDKKKEEVKKRSISVSKKKISRGQTIIERGKGFSKKSTVSVYFSKLGKGYYAPKKIKTNSSGKFSLSYKIPANKPTGTYSWYAVDDKTGKKSKVVKFVVK